MHSKDQQDDKSVISLTREYRRKHIYVSSKHVYQATNDGQRAARRVQLSRRKSKRQDDKSPREMRGSTQSTHLVSPYIFKQQPRRKLRKGTKALKKRQTEQTKMI